MATPRPHRNRPSGVLGVELPDQGRSEEVRCISRPSSTTASTPVRWTTSGLTRAAVVATSRPPISSWTVSRCADGRDVADLGQPLLPAPHQAHHGHQRTTAAGAQASAAVSASGLGLGCARSLRVGRQLVDQHGQHWRSPVHAVVVACGQWYGLPKPAARADQPGRTPRAVSGWGAWPAIVRAKLSLQRHMASSLARQGNVGGGMAQRGSNPAAT